MKRSIFTRVITIVLVVAGSQLACSTPDRSGQLTVETQLEESLFDYILNSWEHIDAYLIDKTYGGWYNYATDTYPETVDQGKSHIWKTSYHNARGMLNCIKMLRMK